MKKDTEKLLEELDLCADFSTFYEENSEHLLNDTLAQILSALMDEKDLRKSHVFKKAEISEVYGYQIFSGVRVPDRRKLLCLAIGMDLSAEETQVLLKRGGYPPLYVKQPQDCVILYGICHHLSVAEINTMLFEYGLETLG